MLSLSSPKPVLGGGYCVELWGPLRASCSWNWPQLCAMLFRFSFCRAVEWELEPDLRRTWGISLSPPSHRILVGSVSRGHCCCSGSQCWGCDSGCRLCGTLASFPGATGYQAAFQKGSSCLRSKWTSWLRGGLEGHSGCVGLPVFHCGVIFKTLWGWPFQVESSAASLWREWLGELSLDSTPESEESLFVKEGIWQVLFGLDEGSNGLCAVLWRLQCSLCFPFSFLVFVESLSSGVLSDSSVPDWSSSLGSFW